MIYPNLPGIQITTLDGGLTTVRTPQDKAILIIGTAGQGPADEVYQTTDISVAAGVFGLQGSLVQALTEAQGYSDNISLFRMGATPATLTGVGATSAAAGMSVTFNAYRTATVNSDYKIWYNTGILYIWNQTGTLVYSNDSAVHLIDTGDVYVTGSATAGLAIGTTSGPTAKTIAGAITVGAAAALTGSGGNTAPVFTAAVTGLGMTKRHLYVALNNAFSLLNNFRVQYVFAPDIVADNPNIAFYAPANPNSPTAAESVNDPTVNPDALGWLKTWVDANGNNVYHWANETNDSAGNVVASAPFTFTVATNSGQTGRLDKGYHEVNFPYALARYCEQQSIEIGGCMGVIGFQAPKTYSSADIRTWLGKEPTLDPITGAVTASGKGLLGFVYTRGLAQASLHAACADAATFRAGGLFDTDSGEYDGSVTIDKNGYPVDIGTQLLYVGDWAFMANGFGQYPNSLAGTVTGIVSALDDNISTTGQQVTRATQISHYSRAYLDALTRAKIIVLMDNSAGINNPPQLLHGWTGGMKSDFNQLIRMRSKFRVSDITRQVAGPYIGKASIDGLQLTSLLTNLRSRFTNEVKHGYFAQVPDFTVYASAADRTLGQANIDVRFVPPGELVRLMVTVGVQK